MIIQKNDEGDYVITVSQMEMMDVRRSIGQTMRWVDQRCRRIERRQEERVETNAHADDILKYRRARRQRLAVLLRVMDAVADRDNLA